MRSFLSVVAISVVLAFAPAAVRADVTIRYTFETSSPMTPAANKTRSSVIYMKGNKGVMVSDGETTIVDFARQQVTIIDTARKKYATVPASDYGNEMSARMDAFMPKGAGAPGVADMLKTMKTACDTKNSDSADVIQGVHAVEREVSCTLTMDMPANIRGAMPSLGMKMVTRIWSASPSEKTRVPGLWQLSGFELWQSYFMNPTGSMGKMVPDGMKPMIEAMQRDQSAVLRSSMQMSMQMPMAMPGMGSGDTPFMTMKEEMIGLSTELLDDALFSVPSDFSAETAQSVMGGITDAEMASVKADLAQTKNTSQAVLQKTGQSQPNPAIPDNVKAFVPTLVPLTEITPEAPLGPDGNKLQGTVELLVTIGPKGNAEQAEVLSGPEGLRKTATDTVRQWTFRPVIRNGAAVTAYTQADVNFIDLSKGKVDTEAFHYTPEMQASMERLAQLEDAFPRTPEQEMADLEQDSSGGDKSRRYDRLGELALMAVQLGADDKAANEKAKAYSTELLADAEGDVGGWNHGNAIHDGHTVLGLLALRNDDLTLAGQQLLEAGKTAGSPQLDSFGPNMTLAAELLKKGERNTVLDYFELCRKFWKTGGEQLDAWSATVRKGETPDFAGSLR